MEETKEEVIEEIVDNEKIGSSSETVGEEVLADESTLSDSAEIIDESASKTEMIDESLSKEDDSLINSVYKKKSKTPLLVILFILLFLDIAALIIYIIGINKVLSFIK